MPGKRKQDLDPKMAEACDALQGYVALKKVKGYMSVAESAALKEKLFALCAESREDFTKIRDDLVHEEILAFLDGTGALTTAILSQMTGK